MPKLILPRGRDEHSVIRKRTKKFRARAQLGSMMRQLYDGGILQPR
jgi:hypothetical protein